MTDRFQNTLTDLDDPGRGAIAVTPDDTADLPEGRWSRYLRVGFGGSLRVMTVDGDVVTYENVASPEYVFVRVRRVFATGTTCTNIVGHQ